MAVITFEEGGGPWTPVDGTPSKFGAISPLGLAQQTFRVTSDVPLTDVGFAIDYAPGYERQQEKLLEWAADSLCGVFIEQKNKAGGWAPPVAFRAGVGINSFDKIPLSKYTVTPVQTEDGVLPAAVPAEFRITVKVPSGVRPENFIGQIGIYFEE